MNFLIIFEKFDVNLHFIFKYKDMNTSFHFTSAQEVTLDIIEVIRRTYQEKLISIYIQEDELFAPEWQMQEVRRRDAIIEKNSDRLLDCDVVINELEKELETV